MTAAFQANDDMLHVRTKSILDESANSINVTERFYAPIFRAFSVIQKEFFESDEEEALQMAFKSINDSVRSDGLVATLLVFGALQRLGITTDQPSKTTL